MQTQEYEQQGQEANNFSDVRSALRRRYPKDKVGAKDEWQAVIQHQAEMHQEILKFEKELKNLRAKDLAEAHDIKMYERLKQKEAELIMKMKDAEAMAMRLEQYKQELMKNKQDRAILQQGLAESYENAIENKNKIITDIKLRTLEEERRNLEEAKRLLELERQKELMKLKQMQDNYNEDMAKAQEKAYYTKLRELEEKLAYNEMMRQNEQKQLLKEANYRNFFKLTAEAQKQLGDLHAQNVLSPQLEKQKAVEGFIQKGVITENERKLRDEMNRLKARYDQYQSMNQGLKEQMSYHDQLKEYQKLEKKQQQEERLRQAAEYQAYQQFLKEQKKEYQRSYKEFLDKQAADHEERMRMNRMTKEEKKLNFYDLQAYKDQDPKLYSLVPGFINSKFSPLHNNPKDPAKSQQNIFSLNAYDKRLGTFDGISGIGPDQSLNTLKALSKEIDQHRKTLNQSFRVPSNDTGSNQSNDISPTGHNDASSKQSMETSPLMPTYQVQLPIKIGSKHVVQSPKASDYSTSNLLSPTHNPILNPLPYSIQNPYLLKEINRYSSKRLNLANVGNSVVNG